jgi:hypothetical protein
VTLPGITSVAWSGTLPGVTASLHPVKVEPPGLAHKEVMATAGPFRPRSLARIVLPPASGRMFGARDTRDTCRVVVVNAATAASWFDNDAVGRVMEDESGQRVEIVGVVTPKEATPDTTSGLEPAVYYYAEQGQIDFSLDAPIRFSIPILPPSRTEMLDLRVVSASYFAQMGLSHRAGALFPDTPAAGSCRVGVINQQAAELYFGGNAVGGAVIDGAGRRTTIVGVVEDARLRAIERKTQPALYVPMTQDFLPGMHAILGAVDPGADLQDTMQRRLEAVDGGKPDAVAVISLEDHLRRTALAPERIATLLLGVGSINALAIGILGLYRVIADEVLERRREIAVRAALGAQRWRLIGMVVVQGTSLAAGGTLFGIALALLLASWMRTVTGFDASPIGWAWFAGPLVLVIGALVASVLPARAILRVAPLAAIRAE